MTPLLSALYADDPARRARQLVGDLLTLAWVVLWVLVGRAVHGRVAELAAPGRTLEDGGRALEDGLRSAGEQVARTPVLGDELRAPLDAAGGAAAHLADAGVAVQTGVARAAVLAALAVAAWPVLLAVVVRVLQRRRGLRRAAEVRTLLRSDAGRELLALRTLVTTPLRQLGPVGEDPVAAWRRGDPDTIRALAALGAGAEGVRPERAEGLRQRR